MADIWFTASLWLGLALLATFVSMQLRVSVALIDIIIGVAAQFALRTIWRADLFGAQAGWVVFLASVGEVLRPFLAAVEPDPCVWTTLTVQKYLTFLRTKVNGTTVHLHFSKLRAFFQWCLESNDAWPRFFPFGCDDRMKRKYRQKRGYLPAELCWSDSALLSEEGRPLPPNVACDCLRPHWCRGGRS